MHGVILLAAGSSTRMGNTVEDKILAKVGKNNAFTMSLLAFAGLKKISTIVIVYRDEPQKKNLIKDTTLKLEPYLLKNIIWVKGGKQRGDSVQNGLKALPEACEFAHIHDCARPLIRQETIQFIISHVSKYKAVAIAKPVTNTIRKNISSEEGAEGSLKTETLDRNQLWEMETPQSAPKSWLIQGYQKASELNIVITDDMHAIELLAKRMILHDPGYPNPKITHPQDLNFINFLTAL
jgi:2-C-methyl-D-erythritol 4-phosphate cytidylyltransferase